MIMTILRRAALSVLLAGVSTTAYCQDLIARQAPVDRRQRAIDSVAIQRAIDRDLEMNLNTDIYSSWITNPRTPLPAADVPDSFCIDLRGFCMPTTSRNITSRYGYLYPPSAEFTKDLTSKCTPATPSYLPSTAKYAWYAMMPEDTATT